MSNSSEWSVYSINKIKEQITTFLLDRVVSKKDSQEITKNKYKFVNKISDEQRNDGEFFLFYYVIHGHFDELKKRLDKKEKDINKMDKTTLEKKLKEYNLTFMNDHKRLTVMSSKKNDRVHNNTLTISDKDTEEMQINDMRNQLMELSVCEEDMVGANIFHLAYLYHQYDIAHYLVERFPRWAYLPYAEVYLINPFEICPAFAYSSEQDNNSSNSNYSDINEKLKRKRDACKQSIDEFRTHVTDLLENKDDVDQEIAAYSQYTGENILHIAIIQRNVSEVRWILNFYRDHIYSEQYGLPCLLSSEAVGTFFQRIDDSIYFGTTALQFAISSNDQEIFNLVYSCSCNCNQPVEVADKSKSKPLKQGITTLSNFGPNSIFKTDSNGNNALHLCAINGLTEMYDCVYKTALHLMVRTLRDIYCKHSIDSKDPTKNFQVLGNNQSGSKSGMSPKPSSNSIKSKFPSATNILGSSSQIHPGDDSTKYPTMEKKLTNKSDIFIAPGQSIEDSVNEFESPFCLTVKRREKLTMPSPQMKEHWIQEQAKEIIKGELVLVLNKELHSPLTLAAAVLKKNKKFTDSEILKRKKRIEMFEYLLKFLKRVVWSYGPTKMEALELQGIEINYSVLHNYEIDGISYKDVSTAELNGKDINKLLTYYQNHKTKFIVEKDTNCEKWCKLLTEKIPKMLPAIDWLCVNEVDEAMRIPEIKELIDRKWKLMGRPFFILSFYLHLFIALVITVITCLVNYSPSPTSKGSIELTLDVLFAIMILILGIKFIQEIWDLFYHKTIFINFYPFSIHMKYRGITKFDKIAKLLKISSFLVFCVMKGIAEERHGWHYNPYENQGIKIPLVVCVMTCWLHVYYFLMCLDSTGPFVLTMTNIIMTDIPYFLKFYFVVVFAFGCALSMLANTGDLKAGYGFFILLQTIWTLIQQTVQIQNPTHYVTQVPDDFPPDLAWLADLLTTAYYTIANIMMLNLLIALLGNTYNKITEDNSGVLLIAKFNVMHSFELTMDPDELVSNRTKYAEVSSKTMDPGELVSNRTKYAEVSSKIPPSDNSWICWAPKFIRDTIYPPIIVNIYDFKYITTNFEWFNSEKKSSHDIHNVLFIIDPQIDFHEGGSLAVPGALEDSNRIAKMIDDYGSHIHEIYVSLDSHYPKHIAHAICWRHGDYYRNNANKLPLAKRVDHLINKYQNYYKKEEQKRLENQKKSAEQQNKIEKVKLNKIYDENYHPVDYTKITYNEILQGIWVYKLAENSDDKQNWVEKYTNTLEFQGRKLTIWPEHCIIGSDGHSVVPVINDALQKWASDSKRPVNYILKGQNLYTEMYSALKAEVEDPNDIHTALNEDLINKFKLSDRLLICGQALSHSVNYTTRDLINNWGNNDLSNIILIKDASSPVVGSQGLADEFLHYAEKKGLQVLECNEVFQGYLKNEMKNDNMIEINNNDNKGEIINKSNEKQHPCAKKRIVINRNK